MCFLQRAVTNALEKQEVCLFTVPVTETSTHLSRVGATSQPACTSVKLHFYCFGSTPSLSPLPRLLLCSEKQAGYIDPKRQSTNSHFNPSGGKALFWEKEQVITSAKAAQFCPYQGVTPAPGLWPHVCPVPLGNGNSAGPKVTALAGTASKAAERLCLSGSTDLGSQNKPKLTRAQKPSPMKTGTFWACARREHFVPGKLVKASGAFSVYSWYNSCWLHPVERFLQRL